MNGSLGSYFKPVLTPKREVAAIERWIRRYAASGKLASIRIGNRLRFEPTVVAEFLENRSSN
jgi:hypothetical protein